MLEKDLEKVITEELYDTESRRMTEEMYLMMMESHQKNNPKQAVNYPDAKRHQLVSFIKSAIRIAGYLFIPSNIILAAGLLLAAEVVGILEELV